MSPSSSRKSLHLLTNGFGWVASAAAATRQPLSDSRRCLATRQAKGFPLVAERYANLIGAGARGYGGIGAGTAVAGPTLVLLLVCPIKAVGARIIVLTRADRIRVSRVTSEALDAQGGTGGICASLTVCRALRARAAEQWCTRTASAVGSTKAVAVAHDSRAARVRDAHVHLRDFWHARIDDAGINLRVDRLSVEDATVGHFSLRGAQARESKCATGHRGGGQGSCGV